MRRSISAALFGAIMLAGTVHADNWYERSFYLLHEDHHTSGEREVGRDADREQTAKLVALASPDVIQIHAKGNPGWTTYPTKIGHTPPKLACDVLKLWCDVAREGGYPFSAYYNLGRDGEIMTRRPEWNRVDAAGKPWDRALCYHSGVAENYLWPMIREIINGYHPDGFWFDGSCFTVRVCYCDACRERFRREHNLDPPKSPNEKGWAAYQEMQRQIYREFVHETTAVIHRLDPKCLVAVNWAYSLRMPEKPDPEIAYLTGDIGNRVEGLSAEAHWYDSQSLPFDLMTQISTLRPTRTSGVETSLQMAPKPAVQIEQEMAVIVANGGRYFAWDNPTPESGLVPERFEFLARVVKPFLRAREPWCLGWQRVPDVSLLHSKEAHYAVGDSSTVCFGKSDNRIDGATEALTRLHLNYEMVPDWRLADGDVRSPLLIVEHPKVLTQKTVDALIRFVHDGGHLLMTGMGVTRDKRLAGLFGIADCTGPQGPEPLTVRLDGKLARFDHWLFRMTCEKAHSLLDVEDADGQTYPLLTQNRAGSGVAYYVPIPLLTKHGENVVPSDLLEAVFDTVLPRQQRFASTDAPATVELGLRRKGSQYAMHLINMAPGEREIIRGGTRRYPLVTSIPPVKECRVSLRLPEKPSTVELQPQGTVLKSWRFDNGVLEVTVPRFDVHQIVVATIGRQP